MAEKGIFKFTGNPFVDAGTAVITAWTASKKNKNTMKPEDVSVEDVKELLPELAELYTSSQWKKDSYQ
ncbi:unnamed protein product, partial [marine sediment metagenome]